MHKHTTLAFSTSSDREPFIITWDVSVLIRQRVAIGMFDTVGRNPRVWNRFEVLFYVPRET